MRYVVPVIEQLSRAADELGSSHTIDHRLGYMLVDNAAELIVNRYASNVAATSRSWMASPTLTPRQSKQARRGKFDDRLGVLVAIGALTPDERSFSSICHDYRNRVHHAGLDHEDVVQVIGGAYYRWCCELFVRLPPMGYVWTSGEPVSDRARTLIDAIRAEEDVHLVPHVEQLAPRLLRMCPDTPAVAPVLQNVAYRAIDAVGEAIDFIRTDAPRRLSVETIVRDSRINMEIEHRLEEEGLDGDLLRTDVDRIARRDAIVAEVRRDPPEGMDRVPFRSWRARAAQIGRQSSERAAVIRYQELRRSMDRLETAIGEMAFRLDMWLQERLDLARGK